MSISDITILNTKRDGKEKKLKKGASTQIQGNM
jgi:hypothetical protein